MLRVEEYISQMKKKEKLDEFNLKNHAQNMASVISYVMEYFNNYLNPETYNYEEIKTQELIDKIVKEVETTFPKSKDFIVEYYKAHKIRLDRTFKKYVKEFEYIDLFYTDEDFNYIVDKFCLNPKMKNSDIELFKDKLFIMAKEIKNLITEKPLMVDLKHLDGNLIKWINEIYREYKVNLYAFASSITDEYYDKYVEYKRSAYYDQYIYVNNYNHRYNDDPFCIDDIYENNKHRPFLKDKKGELEMLMMHDWVFYIVQDSEYWNEYVNLCVSTGRVKNVKSVNRLLPVINNGVQYPEDVRSNIEFLESKDGLLKSKPQEKYILRISYKDSKDDIWKDEKLFNNLINNLHITFENYGSPEVLELLSPVSNDSFTEEEFLMIYGNLEKSMKKYRNMKIGIVNGAKNDRRKFKYMVESIEDIEKVLNKIIEFKYKLKLVVDINLLIGWQNRGNNLEGIFEQLLQVRNSIIGVHFSDKLISTSASNGKGNGDHFYLNQSEYPEFSNLLKELSILFNDNQSRYFVPEKIEKPLELEELIDNLLIGGFSFEYQGE